MSRKIATAITILLAAASASAQSPANAPSPAAPPIMAPDPDTTARVISRFGRNRQARAQAQVAPRGRMQEMESTLNAMHALLKQMQDKNASSRSKDPVAKANLEMWELLLGHLDKEFHLLQAATAAREDFDSRRAALYNQAAAKAAAEAAAARQAQQTPPAPSTSAAPKPDQPNE